MNVAAAFIFLIQEVVIPFIILSCFPFKTVFFFFFASPVCTFPLSRWSSILCVCFLKPFVLWWKLLACCCSLTSDRLPSLQISFHPQRHFQLGERCCALWQAVMSMGSLREGLDGMRFRSTCFGSFFSGHGCGFHRPAVENGSVWWLSLHMLPLDLTCSFCQNMNLCHSENAVTSAGTIRVKCFLPVLWDFKIIWKIHFQYP